MVSWVKKAGAALAALTLLAAPASAQVPDPYARELAQRLSQAETLLTENGYARAAGPFAGGAAQGAGRSYTITLRAGQDYRIVGVCERRCADLDLRLVGPGGAMIAQDVLDDAVPIIHVQPRVTGQYSVEAIMARCGADPCWFAFNVYSR
jgi:hypothetical protein